MLRQLTSQIKEGGERLIDAERMTFRELAEVYRQHKVKPAEYIGDRKIAGLRSVRTVQYRINALLEYFGEMRLRSITPGEVHRFKSERLKTKVHSGKKGRSIAAVNRELEVLRAMLRFAKGEGWIDRSPFENISSPIISKADETRRERVLSKDEERRLLSVCVGSRAHLRSLVIAAVDTGMRKGELLSLTWEDVGLCSRTIRLRAFNTKTAKAREVPISERLAGELAELRGKAILDPEGRVFALTKFQHSWDTACRLAEIEGLRFHDLRHTLATRLVSAGMPLEEVAKILGHTQINTTFRHYLNITSETISRAANLLNKMNEAILPNGNKREEEGSVFIN